MKVFKQSVVDLTSDQSVGGVKTFVDNVSVGQSVAFTPIAAPAYSEGYVYYDETNKALSYYNDEAEVTINLGQENVIRIRNVTGVTITNGQAVYINGSQGANLPTVALAQADLFDTAVVVGLATHDIENNTNGYITTVGEVRDLDTSAFAAGDALYLSTTVAGALQNTRPTSAYAIRVGYCTISNVSVGEIKVLPGTTVQEANLATTTYVDDNFVDLTTDQSIGGVKTFTEDLTIDKSGAALILDASATNPQLLLRRAGVNASNVSGNSNGLQLRSNVGVSETNMNMFVGYTNFDHDVRSSAAGTEPTSFATKGYVDGELVNYVDFTSNESISGQKTFANLTQVAYPHAQLWINADTGTIPRLYFMVNTLANADMLGLSDRLLMRRFHSAAGTATTFELYDDYITTNKVIRGVDPVASTDLTTLSYVEDNFVALDGDTMTGRLVVAEELKVNNGLDDRAYLRLDNTGELVGLIFTDAKNSLTFEYYVDGDTFTRGSQLVMSDDLISVNLADLRLNAMGTDIASAVRKDYVDNGFLPITGGTVTGDLSLTDTDDMYLTLNSDTLSSLIDFRQGDVLHTRIGTNSTNAYIRHVHSAAGTNTEFKWYDDYLLANKVIRGVTPVIGTDLTTKDYVDDGFVDMTSVQSVGGVKTFIATTSIIGDLNVGDGTVNNNYPVLRLDAGAAGAPSVEFKHEGVIVSEITGFDTRLELSCATNTLDLYTTFSIFNSPVRGPTPVSTTDLTTKAYVDDGFVNLTTAQTVAGIKTLTSNPVIKKATPYLFINADTGNPNIQMELADVRRALMFTNGDTTRIRSYLIDGVTFPCELTLSSTGYASVSTVMRAADPVGSTDLTTKSYVEDNFVDLTTNQTIAGTKTFTNNMELTKATPVFTLDASTGTTPSIVTRVNSVRTSELLGLVDRTILRHAHTIGGGDTQLDMYDDYAIFNKVVRGSDPVGSTDLTTKSYVDGNFVDLTTSQTVSGQKTFTDVVKVNDDDAQIWINANGVTTPRLYFKKDGATNAEIWGLGNRMLIRRKHSAAGVDGYLELYDDYLTTNKVMRGISPVGPNDFTTLGYTESNFLPLIGGTIKAVSGNTTLVIDADGGNSYQAFRIGNVTYSQMSNFTTSFVISRPQGTAAFTLYDTSAKINVPLVCEVAPTGAGHLTRKDYVDDNFVDKTTTQTIAGTKTFTDNPTILSSSSPAKLTVKANLTSAAAQIDLLDSDSTQGQLIGTDTRMLMRRVNTGSGTNDFSVYNDYSIFNKVVRGVTPVGTTDLTTKAYVDDNANVVQQAAGYEVVMPAATPTVGQQLQVGSVVSGVVTMVWV